MRIPQLRVHLQPRDEVTQINQNLANKQIPQSYRLDPIPTSMSNKDKEKTLTTEWYKQPYAERISDLRTGTKDKTTVTSKDTVSQREIPSPQERVSQEMYRNVIRYDQNELGFHEKIMSTGLLNILVQTNILNKTVFCIKRSRGIIKAK